MRRKPLVRIRFRWIAAYVLLVGLWMLGVGIANAVSHFAGGTIWTVYFLVIAGFCLLVARALDRVDRRIRASRSSD